MINRKMKIQIALPFLLIITSLVISKLITFQPALTTNEMRLLNFLPEMIDIPERQPYLFIGGLKSPIEIVTAPEKGYPPIPLSAIASRSLSEVEEPSAIKVSMIVVSERRIAVVNGAVVKEGESIGGMRIMRIEKDRILLKGVHQKGGTKWAYLEEIK